MKIIHNIYQKTSRMALIAMTGIMTAASQAYSATNPDLDADGIILTVKFNAPMHEDGTIEIPISTAQIWPLLSRTPKPRNEWYYDDFVLEQSHDGVNWTTMHNDEFTTIDRPGLHTVMIRAKMQFYKIGITLEEPYAEAFSSTCTVKYIMPEDPPPIKID